MQRSLAGGALSSRSAVAPGLQPALRAAPRAGGRRGNAGARCGASSLFGYRRDLVEKFDLGPSLGAGTYGEVRTGAERATGALFAVKSIPKFLPRLSPPQLAAYRQKIKREVSAQYTMGRSLNVAYLYDAFEDDTHVHLVMERCTGGSIWQRRDIVEGRFSEAAAAVVMRGALRALAQCHARGIAYRDVKPDNFLYENPSEGAPLKLVDFGLAAPLSAAPFTERCGTLPYVSPEVVSQRYEGPEADCWAAGVMAYQLLSGRTPFSDPDNPERPQPKALWRSILFDAVDLDSPPWPAVSPAAKDLVRRLLEREPRKRISAAAAAEHAWVREDGIARTAALDGTVVARLQRFGTAGALRQAALRAMARQVVGGGGGGSAPPRALAGVVALWERLAGADAAAAPRGALVSALAADGYTLTRGEWEQLERELDPAGTGAVSRADFVAALADWGALARDTAGGGGPWAAWARGAFDALHQLPAAADAAAAAEAAAGEGIAVEELMDEVCLMEEEGELVCRGAVEEALKAADANGDGRLDFDEFCALIRPQGGLAPGAGGDDGGDGDGLSAYDRRLAPAPAAPPG